jgi:hypothetical protein
MLGDKYARAVKVGAHAQPVMFPLADATQVDSLLALVDGHRLAADDDVRSASAVGLCRAPRVVGVEHAAALRSGR